MCISLFTCRRRSGAEKPKASSPSARPVVYHTKNTSTSTISSFPKSEKSSSTSSTKNLKPPHSAPMAKKPAPAKLDDALFQQRLAEARSACFRRHQVDYRRHQPSKYEEGTWKHKLHSQFEFDGFGSFGDGGGGGGFGGGGDGGGGGGGC